PFRLFHYRRPDPGSMVADHAICPRLRRSLYDCNDPHSRWCLGGKSCRKNTSAVSESSLAIAQEHDVKSFCESLADLEADVSFLKDHNCLRASRPSRLTWPRR